MTLGSVFPGSTIKVLTVAKDAVNAITKGSVCVPDTSITPNGYKKATAAASVTGPFVVCVNKDAAAADTAFAAAFPGTMVTVTAQGAIAPGKEVQCSATVAGAVAQFAGAAVATPTAAEVLAVQADRLRVVGRYIGHESEITGKTPATSAADGETNIVIVIGGSA
jgi:hypothetical protein